MAGNSQGKTTAGDLYRISRDQWNAIPDGYKLQEPGKPRATFKCFLTPDGSGGDVLCFEGQHFIIDEQGAP